MKTLTYKRKWRADETIRAAERKGTLVSWWRASCGSIVVLVLKKK